MDDGQGEACGTAGRAVRLVAELSSPEGQAEWVSIPDAAVQDLMALAVRIYAARVSGREDPTAPVLPAYRPESGVGATQVAIAAEQLLAAADMDIFELQMWRMLGAR